MTKKGNLASALQSAAGKTPLPELPVTQSHTEAPQKYRQPSRQGKKVVNAFVDPAVSRELKHLAADEDTTMQNLFIEAINDLLVKYGKNPIA